MGCSTHTPRWIAQSKLTRLIWLDGGILDTSGPRILAPKLGPSKLSLIAGSAGWLTSIIQRIEPIIYGELGHVLPAHLRLGNAKCTGENSRALAQRYKQAGPGQLVSFDWLIAM